MDFNIIEILILVIVLYLFSAVIKLDGRIKAMQNKLDRISKQVGMPESPVNPEIMQLIDEGNDVKAIKRARELFGFTLLEGKEYIDDLKTKDK